MMPVSPQAAVSPLTASTIPDAVDKVAPGQFSDLLAGLAPTPEVPEQTVVAAPIPGEATPASASTALPPTEMAAAASAPGRTVAVPSALTPAPEETAAQTATMPRPFATPAARGGSKNGKATEDRADQEKDASPVATLLNFVSALIPPPHQGPAAEKRQPEPAAQPANEAMTLQAAGQRPKAAATALPTEHSAPLSEVASDQPVATEKSAGFSMGAAPAPHHVSGAIGASDLGARIHLPVQTNAVASPASITPHAAHPEGLDLTNLDSLVRDISEMTGRTGHASFRLSAEHLGPLEVRLSSSEAGVSVMIRTEREEGHSAVSQAQRQLSDDMRSNGVRVTETSVAMSNGGTANGDPRERAFHQQRFAARIEAALAPRDDNDPEPTSRSGGRFA